jgi:hypothetical protein
MRQPKAFTVALATVAGVSAAPIFIRARSPNPLRTGPGADTSTSTPRGPSSTCNASPNDCTYALLAA